MYKIKNDPRIKLSRDKWYKKNKKRQITNQTLRKKYLISFIERYKKLLKCFDCSLSFKYRPECCDFHHIDPSTKRDAITKLTKFSIKTIKNEIRKCIPLCANCHRSRHKIRV